MRRNALCGLTGLRRNIADLIATHPPKIKVRFVSIERMEDSGCTVKFMLVNVGEAEAIIYARSTGIEFWKPKEGLPAVPPYRKEFFFEDQIKLKGGAEEQMIVNINKEGDLTGDSLTDSLWRVAVDNGARVLYFLGYILYKDEIGTIRRTAFCRTYDPQSKRFTPSSDPEYEYAD